MRSQIFTLIARSPAEGGESDLAAAEFECKGPSIPIPSISDTSDRVASLFFLFSCVGLGGRFIFFVVTCFTSSAYDEKEIEDVGVLFVRSTVVISSGRRRLFGCFGRFTAANGGRFCSSFLSIGSSSSWRWTPEAGAKVLNLLPDEEQRGLPLSSTSEDRAPEFG